MLGTALNVHYSCRFNDNHAIPARIRSTIKIHMIQIPQSPPPAPALLHQPFLLRPPFHRPLPLPFHPLLHISVRVSVLVNLILPILPLGPVKRSATPLPSFHSRRIAAPQSHESPPSPPLRSQTDSPLSLVPTHIVSTISLPVPNPAFISTLRSHPNPPWDGARIGC